MEELTSNQISEWQAYDSLEPLGELLDDYRFARLSQVIIDIAQSLYGKEGSSRRIDIEDLMPDYEIDIDPDDDLPEPEYQSVEEMKRIMMSLVATKKGSKKHG